MPLFVIPVIFAQSPRAHAAAQRVVSIAAAGWQDDMRDAHRWSSVSASMPVELSAGTSGLEMSLPHVPPGFPFAYQWSGITRKAVVDLGRFPVLMARVSRMRSGSYAHIEVYERAYDGTLFRSARGSTLRGPGITSLDLGDTWGRDARRVEIRLIVGGPLEGAACEYAWVRAVSHAAAKSVASAGGINAPRADHAAAHVMDHAQSALAARGARALPGRADNKPQAKPRGR